MPYHDTFYVAQNITGYTGVLHELPTVYFRCDITNRIGRITQQHPYCQNVGRSRPMTSIGYRMGNEMTALGVRLVEHYANGRSHTSRNVFVELETGTLGQRHGGNIAALGNSLGILAVLSQSIRNCPQAKQMHGISQVDLAKIAGARAAKDNAMREMLWNNRVMGGLRPSQVRHNAGLLPHLRAQPRVLASGFQALQSRGY